jgi:hypothetical protein
MTPLICALCAGAGALQARLLARELRSGLGPFGFALRFVLVAAVLVWAARSGQLLLGAAAWFLAFFAAGVLTWRRLT